MKRLDHHGLPAAAMLTLVLAAGCSGGGSNSDPADAEIRIAPVSGPVTEAGAETSFTVVLNSKPKSDVTLDLASSDDTEGTVSPASITFTRENWDAPQSVLVTGVDDPIADGNTEFDVTVGIDTTDAAYAALEIDPIAVVNLDDETAGVRVGPVAGVTSETGDAVVVPVVLQSEPAADVVLIFGSSDTSEGSTDSLSLTFTPLDWNAPQNITVTGQDDEIPDGLIEYSVIFQNALSDDPVYAGLPVPSLALANVDDDSPGIVLSPLTAATYETDVSTPSAEISVTLATPPAGNVSISFKSDDTGEGDLQNSSGTGTTTTLTLTFTPSDWNVEQFVRVIGEDDSAADGDQPYKVYIDNIVSASDAAYENVARPEVNLVNIDDDSPGILVSPLSGLGDETGGLMSFVIELRTQPTADVTIPMAVSDSTEASISHSSHTFTTSTWNDPVTVWIAGKADGIPDGNQPWFVQFSPAISIDAAYAGRKPANLSGFTLDDGPIRRAVVYDDAMGTEADDALMARGWVVDLVTTTTDLENAVDAGTADLVIVESSSVVFPASTEASLDAWVTGGGKLILSHWDLDATMTLTSSLDVSVTPYSGHRFVFPQSVELIDLFAMQEDFPFPLTGQDVVVENGQELVPGGSGSIASRLDSLGGPAAIVATLTDRVLVNGFAPDDMAGTDNDGDGIPDVRELYDNEIAFLLKGASPATFAVVDPMGIDTGSTSTFATSQLRVFGVPRVLTDVKVSMHAQHTNNADMEIFLVGPDGTRIELTTDSGSSGDDFGTGCRAADGRVTFDDAAASSTLPSTGPVVGSFKPEDPLKLEVFDGIDPNGTWTLEVADDSITSNFGTVKCWSLHLTF